MQTYYTLSEAYINPVLDTVVKIYKTGDTLKASFRAGDSTSTMRTSVEEALELAAAQARISPDHVIIVDEDELWQDRWGKLIAHPTRGTKLQRLSII